MKETTAPAPPRGLTLVETAALVAGMVILLGTMISLARYVRARSADALTRNLLTDLDRLLEQYVAAHGVPPGIPPAVPLGPIGPAGNAPPLSEADLRAAADANNRAFVRALRADFIGAAKSTAPSTAGRRGPFGDLPVWLYDERELRDAWGDPLIFMSARHPALGTAPGDRPFLFSAGPDRDYLTRADNLYSYESAPAAAP